MREGVYLLVIGVLCPPRVLVRCFRIPLWRKVQRPSVPIPYNPEVRSTFCGRHVHLEQCSVISYSFIFFFDPPLNDVTNRRFLLAPHLIFPAHFFCFCNTCLFVTFRTSFGVAGPNIILIYSGMASKFIRYSNIVNHSFTGTTDVVL